jgi:hypothetical protein
MPETIEGRLSKVFGSAEEWLSTDPMGSVRLIPAARTESK